MTVCDGMSISLSSYQRKACAPSATREERRGQPFHIDIAGKPQSQHVESAAARRAHRLVRASSNTFGALGVRFLHACRLR